MSKLAAPFIARSGARRSTFNEGISVPPEAWAKEVAANPALASQDRTEAGEATRQSILTGSLAKYRVR